jgi:predicted amidophosphoribosyltransferase
MECPKCLFENPEGAKFCIECEAKLELACPRLGTTYTSESKFCDECGYKLDIKEENELPRSRADGVSQIG